MKPASTVGTPIIPTVIALWRNDMEEQPLVFCGKCQYFLCYQECSTILIEECKYVIRTREVITPIRRYTEKVHPKPYVDNMNNQCPYFQPKVIKEKPKPPESRLVREGGTW
jgi:hypothetical protein